jgi:hypothetical protein
VRTRGGIAAFLGVVFVAVHASAEEAGASPSGAETGSTAIAGPGFVDRLFGIRELRGFAHELLVQLVDGPRAEFDRLTERYAKLVEFTKRLEARDEAEFEARAIRYERLRAFTRRLEAEQAEREERDFEAQVALAVRERAFTQELERRRAEAAATADTSTGSDHWPLYQRE